MIPTDQETRQLNVNRKKRDIINLAVFLMKLAVNN